MDRVEDDCVSTTQLLDLNDDCLLEIFQYVSLRQKLKLVGRVCTRIDDIICPSFSSMNTLSFSLRSAPKFNAEHLDVIGRSLRSLYITASGSQSAALVLNYLRSICSHKRLQFLTLRYIRFNENYQECVMNVAEQLQFLDLSFCKLTDELLGPILEKSINLSKLTLFGNADLKFVSLNCITSPHLKAIHAEKNNVCNDEIEKFSEKNANIIVVIFSHGHVMETTFNL